MSAGYRGRCVADHGPRSIRIYTAEDCPRLVATIRAVDHGSVDDLLCAHGWQRVEAWQHSDDGHKIITIKRIDDRAIDMLESDKVDVRARTGTPHR